MVDYRTKVYLLTFLAYLGVHALRTSYSFSKHTLADVLTVNDAQLGLVDSLMIYSLALGYLQISLFPFPRPLLALYLGLLLSALVYMLLPLVLSLLDAHQYTALCVLMSLDGYFQSWTWPHILMFINSEFDNKREALKLGIWSTNSNVGNIFGLTVCQYLVVNTGLPWQVSMLIVGLYLILIALLLHCNLNQLPRTEEIPASPSDNDLLESQSGQSQSEAELREELLVRKKETRLQNEHMLTILKSPIVILMTITFSFIKSIEYGIMLWLPLYFDGIGLEEYSAYIPIAFDSASIISSVALGQAFKLISNKGFLLAPLIFLLNILFLLLRYLDASVTGYFLLVAGVGLFLGGCYNAFASLVTMELVKVIEPRLRTKYLGFYTSVMMFVANLVTGTFQLVIGFKMGKNESLIFTLFFWLGVVILALLITTGIIERSTAKQGSADADKQIQIVNVH